MALNIKSSAALSAALKHASETNSEASLVRNLVRLNNMFGDATIELTAEMFGGPTFLAWYAHRGDEVVFYNGGLVCHDGESGAEWNLHS